MPEMPMPLGAARNVRLLVLGTTVPACSRARSRKNRPFSGISTIFLLSTTEPRLELSVETVDGCDSTVITVLVSPTCSTGSTRDLSSTASTIPLCAKV